MLARERAHVLDDPADAQEAAAFKQDNEAKSMFRIRELTANVRRVDTPSKGTYF